MSSYSLLQGIFPTQGPNPGLLHCRQILDRLSHQGNHKMQVLPLTDFLLGLPGQEDSSAQQSCHSVSWSRRLSLRLWPGPLSTWAPHTDRANPPNVRFSLGLSDVIVIIKAPTITCWEVKCWSDVLSRKCRKSLLSPREWAVSDGKLLAWRPSPSPPCGLLWGCQKLSLPTRPPRKNSAWDQPPFPGRRVGHGDCLRSCSWCPEHAD